MKLRSPKPVTLDPITPSAAVRAGYEKRLLRAVEQISSAYSKTVTKAYREQQARIVMDATPAAAIARVMDIFSRDWLRRFDVLADDLSRWFATRAADRADSVLASSLRRNGFTVRFRLTAVERDAMAAVVQENVSLIKSIGSQYLDQAQGAVMRSVAAGRDLQAATDELEKVKGVTRRRAARIALDQNNSATAMLSRSRQLELGITRAKWLHSAGGKTPRPSHVEFSGREYDVAKGVVLDPAEGTVWPGTAISCRCVSIPVVPGFDD